MKTYVVVVLEKLLIWIFTSLSSVSRLKDGCCYTRVLVARSPFVDVTFVALDVHPQSNFYKMERRGGHRVDRRTTLRA